MPMHSVFYPCVAVLLAIAASAGWPATLAAADKLQYNRDIRPILAESCFPCHGPDSASRKADLRLDKREVAVEHDAIVPGKPAQSSLVERISSGDADEMMPPPASKKRLTDA